MYKDELVTPLSIVGPITAHCDSNSNSNTDAKVAANENGNASHTCNPQYGRRFSALVKSVSDAKNQELNACKFDLVLRTQSVASICYARNVSAGTSAPPVALGWP